MKKFTRPLAIILSVILCLAGLSAMIGCEKEPEVVDEGYQPNKELDTTVPVELRIASSKESWPEMDNVIAKFEEVYPNCTIVCENIENYAENLSVRLALDEQKIDIFRTVNIQATTEYKDYALNLISEDSKKYLDLSQCNAGLVDNFRYTDAPDTQYAIPYGGEMRGMYVNTTLLGTLGLEVPTNRAELLHCCEVLYDAGYIPFQSACGTFAQQLMYPYICNSIVNGGKYDEMYAAIENIEPGISEYFREAYTFLYDIVEKGYYDYKRVENELGYVFDGSDGKAKEFLNIAQISEDVFEKQDDIGKMAFITDTRPSRPISQRPSPTITARSSMNSF